MIGEVAVGPGASRIRSTSGPETREKARFLGVSIVFEPFECAHRFINPAIHNEDCFVHD
jgi:hypothetical protein